METNSSSLSLKNSETTLRLDGKVAWVTGGGRGIGRAIALGLADAGASVAVTARTVGEVEQVADEIASLGAKALSAPGSVTCSSDVNDAVEEIQDEFGRLDILVNSAGRGASLTRSEAVSDDEWQETIAVNLSGAFFCSRAAVRYMGKTGGSIVNISSVHGLVGMGRMTAYAASKGGVELMTRSLALEWASRGIRVNSVAPGYFETDMTQGLRSHDRWRQRLLGATPLGRFGHPREIVPAVTYLASDASEFVTGTTLSIDGGWSAQ